MDGNDDTDPPMKQLPTSLFDSWQQTLGGIVALGIGLASGVYTVGSAWRSGHGWALAFAVALLSSYSFVFGVFLTVELAIRRTAPRLNRLIARLSVDESSGEAPTGEPASRSLLDAVQASVEARPDVFKSPVLASLLAAAGMVAAAVITALL